MSIMIIITIATVIMLATAVCVGYALTELERDDDQKGTNTQ